MNLYRAWIKSVSLRKRLLWSVLLPMLILMLINVAVVNKFGYDSANRRHDRFLLDVSNTLLDQLHLDQGRVEFNFHSSALGVLAEDEKDQVYFSLAGAKRAYLFGYPDLPEPPEPPGETPLYYFADYQGRPVRMMTVLIPKADHIGEAVVVTVGKTLLLHHKRAQEWIWRVLPAHFILMMLSGALVWWGVGRGLQPLLSLRDEVLRRSSLDLHPLPEEQIISEMRPLIHSFNELMARLDISLSSQRRFISNAAHQLRTPLSGFKTQAELIMRMDSVEEIHHTVQQLHIAADHAGHLINQLLVLASSEPGAQDSFTELDVAVLARKVTESWVHSALNKEIDLGFECVGLDFSLAGDALLLGEMLNNLIDNALRYTTAGGLVTVRVSHDEALFKLEVEDNGPGIPAAERDRIFERFYRVAGTGQDGCGLGLPIVREIAHRHHSEVFVLSGANECGTLMRVIFDVTSCRPSTPCTVLG
ncbi:MAG: sensor histidine kinase N-terminal domain-containing protein [Gallionella sp.]|nr:sensor histidine kinase N-terminal domain-containing protein [Gallionella sp.]